MKISKYANSNANTYYKVLPERQRIGCIQYSLQLQQSAKHENFVPINCGGIPDQLIESELFGYEKGAFTAEKVNLGFSRWHYTAIFLDEFPNSSFSTV